MTMISKRREVIKLGTYTEVDSLENFRVEVRTSITGTDRDTVARLGKDVFRVSDVRDQERRAGVTDRVVRVRATSIRTHEAV